MVFYRKYRPQTLEELAGQEVVKRSLALALSSGRLSHAYLFCGPKGTGKTSTARILAKIINCENPPLPSVPCNKCVHCISITDGSNLDVVEMDAASNRGIEDVRMLRESIKLAPTLGKKKVYIIDEVHMLSNDAFNALLKTLEEPPSHVLFVLATTEVQKIPQTVLSRVTKLDFKLVGNEELVGVLRSIADKEKIKIDGDALLLLAQRSGGGIRDGVKLLDQLSHFGSINRQVVEDNLGAGSLEGMAKLLVGISQKRLPEALKQLSKLLESGANPRELNLSLLNLLRQMLLMKNGIDENSDLKELAAKFNVAMLLQVMDCFQKSLEQGRFVSIPTLPLEMAVAESCQGRIKNDELPINNEKKEEKTDNLKFGKGNSTKGEESEAISQTKAKEELGGSEIHNSPLDIDNSSDISKIQERWVYILETVRQYNYSLEALLRSAKILGCSEGSVVIEVPYSFHQRILEAPKSRDLLQSILSDILGRSIGISTVLGQKPIRAEEVANVEVAADDEILRIASEIFNSEPVN